MNAATITRAMHTRVPLVLMALITALLGAAVWLWGPATSTFSTQGFVKCWSGTYSLPRQSSVIAGVMLNFAVVALVGYINKAYNLLKSYTQLQGALYLLIQMATPSLLVFFAPGTLMCVVLLMCVLMLFGLYGQNQCDTRPVFTVFALVSACSAYDYSYAIFAPVFLIGCGQMRIMSLRVISATIIGLVVPWIIYLGMGIVTIDQLQLPQISLVMPQVKSLQASVLIATAVFTGFVILGSLLQNIIKILTYNAQFRARQNLLTTITIAAVVAAIVNSANLLSYLPLVNCCAAMQVAHLFGAVHTFAKSYIAIVTIALLYILIFLWQIMIYTTL